MREWEWVGMNQIIDTWPHSWDYDIILPVLSCLPLYAAIEADAKY